MNGNVNGIVNGNVNGNVNVNVNVHKLEEALDEFDTRYLESYQQITAKMASSALGAPPPPSSSSPSLSGSSSPHSSPRVSPSSPHQQPQQPMRLSSPLMASKDSDDRSLSSLMSGSLQSSSSSSHPMGPPLAPPKNIARLVPRSGPAPSSSKSASLPFITTDTGVPVPAVKRPLQHATARSYSAPDCTGSASAASAASAAAANSTATPCCPSALLGSASATNSNYPIGSSPCCNKAPAEHSTSAITKKMDPRATLRSWRSLSMDSIPVIVELPERPGVPKMQRSFSASAIARKPSSTRRPRDRKATYVGNPFYKASKSPKSRRRDRASSLSNLGFGLEFERSVV
ncbi:hypothetical protein CJI97_002647 [Candidozyma auris]|nr:hypothetical protein CJI97_002647 [[Candida] auris]